MALLDTNQLRQDLEIIDDNIRLLEKQYNDYFGGVSYLEPKALLAQTNALVMKWWGKPVSNTQLKFKLQNLVQRYNSYKEKWNRQLRMKARAEKEEEF